VGTIDNRKKNKEENTTQYQTVISVIKKDKGGRDGWTWLWVGLIKQTFIFEADRKVSMGR